MPRCLFPPGLRTSCPMRCPSPYTRNMPPSPSHYAHLDLHSVTGLILVGKDKEWAKLENSNFENEREDRHICNLTTFL